MLVPLIYSYKITCFVIFSTTIIHDMIGHQLLTALNQTSQGPPALRSESLLIIITADQIVTHPLVNMVQLKPQHTI